MHNPILTQSYFDSHKTAGVAWPDDAEYAVVYNHSTWPCGWGKESGVRFFTTEAALHKWIEDQHSWAELEDNYVAYQAYRWDLGPEIMSDLSYDAGNLGMTYEQRVAAKLI